MTQTRCKLQINLNIIKLKNKKQLYKINKINKYIKNLVMNLIENKK